MSTLKTGVCSAVILAAGTAVFAGLTHGFSVFTTEGALRANVQEAPRTVPAVRLQTADGDTLRWGAESATGFASASAVGPASASAASTGSASTPWRVVSFMYTRCTTVCSVQGAESAQLQALLGPAMARGEVALLSVSFDPQHDTPAALKRWQARFLAGDKGSESMTVTPAGGGWQVARPMNDTDLEALLAVFGVKAIPDGLGGFEHNAAFNLVNPQGQLVAVLDWADPQAAARRIRAALGS